MTASELAALLCMGGGGTGAPAWYWNGICIGGFAGIASLRATSSIAWCA
jgi:hypothetical protein